MNNFYYGKQNLPGVNNILGIDNDDDKDMPQPAPVITKELEKNMDLSNNELYKKIFKNKNKSIKF